MFRAGQPLIASVVSDFPFIASSSRHSLSNPCESTFAARGMAGAKVTPRRPRIGYATKTETINERKPMPQPRRKRTVPIYFPPQGATSRKPDQKPRCVGGGARPHLVAGQPDRNS